MRQMAAVLALIFLAGCSSSPTGDAGGKGLAEGTGAGPAGVDAELSLLRFAGGDFEATDFFEATFSSLDVCFVTCTATAHQTIDLTALVPAMSPVELAVTVTGSDGGVLARLEYDEASASRESAGYQGSQIALSAIVVREPDGTVTLALTHALPISPSMEPVELRAEVRSVVRADLLMPGVPAALDLAAGDDLRIEGTEVTQAVLLGPDQFLLRVAGETLNLSLPADAESGTYTLLVSGGEATVRGPNVTLTARRVAVVTGPWRPLPMGVETKWDFEPESAPLQVGVTLRSRPGSSAAFVGSYELEVASPGGTLLAGQASSCGLPTCQSGYFAHTAESAFLDPGLDFGTYKARAFAETGYDMEIAEHHVVVL